MEWRVAKSLLTLREQVDALAPNRNRSSDGSIGDRAHASRTSDHNPNADGVVTAIDITHDPAHGVNARDIAEMLLQSQDARIKYVISNSEIFSSPGFSSSKKPWQWRPYDGANAHTKHVHISVLGSKELYDSTKPWPIEMASKVQLPPLARVPVIGASGNFEKCMQVIEKWEGGFTNDPDDPGGPTNMGVTQGDLARWRDWAVSVDDVRNLTRDEARQIFRAQYWDPINGERLPLAVAQLCLDAAILTGVGRGSRDLQEALNLQNAALAVDGVIGSNTIKASIGADIKRLVTDFGAIAEAYLRGRPGFPKYGKGWLNRLTEVRAIAAEMANAPQPQQPVPGDSPMSTSTTNITSILQQILVLFQEIEKQKAKPVDPATPTPPQVPVDDLKKILDVIGGVVGKTNLGPVNGALGEGIGNMLNGRKTAIGLIGAVATQILAVPAVSSAISTAIPALAATPIAPFALPIFLGLSAWGALGKMEKWRQAAPKP